MDPHADPAGLPEGAPAPFSLKPETAPTVASPIAPDAIRKVRRTWVPVRSLTSRHRARIRAHLLGLDEHDRYLRFGFAASDAQISHYADALDFERDELSRAAPGAKAWARGSSTMQSCMPAIAAYRPCSCRP